MSEHAALDAAHAHARAFLDTVPTRPAGPSATVAEVAAALGGPLPQQGSDPVAVVDQLARAADPGLANTPGPRYFGWVMGGSVEAAEEVAGAWLIELLGLPADVSYGFVTGAQMANFTGLASARQAVLGRVGWD